MGVEEAVAAWIDAALAAGEAIPGASSLYVIQTDAAYAGRTSAVVSVDPGLLDDTTERVIVTLPRRVSKRLAALARVAGETRSG